jgi:hypothetical protein
MLQVPQEAAPVPLLSSLNADHRKEEKLVAVMCHLARSPPVDGRRCHMAGIGIAVDRLAGHFSGPVWIKRRRDVYCDTGGVFFRDKTVSLS